LACLHPSNLVALIKSDKKREVELGCRKLTVNNIDFYLLEVDTSDTNKSLSTKVFKASCIENIEKYIEEIEKRFLKSSLSWPKEYFDYLVGTSNHFWVPHQTSDNNGSLTFEDISKWANRFHIKLS
jgi:hypothetical protein